MEETPPFKAEYAKSDRASCKGCFVGICKDDLRMAEMVQVRLYCLYPAYSYNDFLIFVFLNVLSFYLVSLL